MAHVCGLGYLVDPAHVRTTLRSILKYNTQTGFFDHFNCLRSFVLGDETALLMASYPKGRPRNPFPYFTEVMTGFEYTAAVGLLYEGDVESGLEVIRNIRARYDGKKRSPFDEAECGHHYARAMASWAAVPALSGFAWDGVAKAMAFDGEGGDLLLVERRRLGHLPHRGRREDRRARGPPRQPVPRVVPAGRRTGQEPQTARAPRGGGDDQAGILGHRSETSGRPPRMTGRRNKLQRSHRCTRKPPWSPRS